MEDNPCVYEVGLYMSIESALSEVKARSTRPFSTVEEFRSLSVHGFDATRGFSSDSFVSMLAEICGAI